MSKEYSEAFNGIIDKFAEQMMRANKEELTAINKTNAIEYLYRTPQVRLLQQSLQRLESIDNANPSEVLRALENLGTHGIEYREPFELGFTKSMPFKSTKEFKIIKQALIKAQENEKVLEILKKKEIDTFMLMLCDNVEQYNSGLKNKPNRQLTQEEFDLLKRWLG